MKTLYILRHAKSSWDDLDLADFDRPLNPRGLLAAPFMGELIATRGFVPSIILCSPARRARQTAELVKDQAALDANIKFDERIYEASPQGLRQVVSELHDSMEAAMVVGHNPGMEGFVRFLTGETETMPTAALAVITLDIDSWQVLNDGCGVLNSVYRPKEEAAKQKAQ